MSDHVSQVNLLSTYREAEVRGARLLQQLLRDNHNPEMILHLTRQLADETRHIQMLTELMNGLGGTLVAVRRETLPSRCRPGRPATTLETLAYLQATEARLQGRYQKHVALRREDARIISTLQRLIADEEWHLASVKELLVWQEKKFGWTRVAATVDYYWDLVRWA